MTLPQAGPPSGLGQRPITIDQEGRLTPLMPTTEPMTIGEIARALARIERGTESLHDKLDARVTLEALERVERDLRTDVDELQANQRKAAWAIVGAVMVAVLSLVVGVPPAG